MSLRFSLCQLQYLVALADCGPIALAAAVKAKSPRRLSAALGQVNAKYRIARVAHRHAHALVATHWGRRYVEQAQTILAEFRALSASSSPISVGTSGP
jgi:DNA-binding transcriptional LysR family regulator